MLDESDDNFHFFSIIQSSQNDHLITILYYELQCVYEKARFEYVGEFYVDNGYFQGKSSHLMVKSFS